MKTLIPLDILTRYDTILKWHSKEVKCEDNPGTSVCHLRWMLHQLIAGRITDNKANRWLGFIQGIMVSEGWLSVKEERDFTRPYFTKVSEADLEKENAALRRIMKGMLSSSFGSSMFPLIERHPTFFGETWDEIFADPIGFADKTRGLSQ